MLDSDSNFSHGEPMVEAASLKKGVELGGSYTRKDRCLTAIFCAVAWNGNYQVCAAHEGITASPNKISNLDKSINNDTM